MKIKKYILPIVLIIINTMVSNILAQDLSKLSEAERNKKLIETAKEVYKAPRLKNFYREYGTPTITEAKTVEIPTSEYNRVYNDPKSIWYGGKTNQKYYTVYFPYDLNKERFDEDYAAKVYIWENTGKAFAIGLGNTMRLPVRDGKIPDHNKIPAPEKHYTITYSKDVPNAASLPKTGKRGDIVTIELRTVTVVANDGWTTEQGYNFDPEKDLINGELISESFKYSYNTETKIIQLMVTGDMKVNVARYQEEYEDPY